MDSAALFEPGARAAGLGGAFVGLAGHEFTYRTSAWLGGVAVGFNF